MCYIVFIPRIQRPLRPASVFSMMMMMMNVTTKRSLKLRPHPNVRIWPLPPLHGSMRLAKQSRQPELSSNFSQLARLWNRTGEFELKNLQIYSTKQSRSAASWKCESQSSHNAAYTFFGSSSKKSSSLLLHVHTNDANTFVSLAWIKK